MLTNKTVKMPAAIEIAPCCPRCGKACRLVNVQITPFEVKPMWECPVDGVIEDREFAEADHAAKS